MEIEPDYQKNLAYLALARQFVESCMQRFGIVSGDQNIQLSIEMLLQSASNKEDRALIRNLKELKSLIGQLNEPLPKDLSKLEEKFRSLLLKCGFDARRLDVGPKITEQNKERFDEERAFDADNLKEAGNKYFNAGDYKKALLYYDKLLATPGVPNDLFVKVAGNNT